MSSSTRLLVLGVVRMFQPVHGYDVRRELLSWRADEWGNVSPGSIYNALKSLTRDGLIEIVGTAQVGGRPERTSYQLTAEGEQEFGQLLRETWWTVGQPLDPLMPALSMMSAMRRDELIAALRHRITQIGGMQEHMRFAIEHFQPDTSPEHVKEMLWLMEARLAAEIAWGQALIGRLEGGGYVTADDPPWHPVAGRRAVINRPGGSATAPAGAAAAPTRDKGRAKAKAPAKPKALAKPKAPTKPKAKRRPAR